MLVEHGTLLPSGTLQFLLLAIKTFAFKKMKQTIAALRYLPIKNRFKWTLII